MTGASYQYIVNIYYTYMKPKMTSLNFQRFGSLSRVFFFSISFHFRAFNHRNEQYRVRNGTGWCCVENFIRFCIISKCVSSKHPVSAMESRCCFVHNKYKILVVPIILLLSNDRFSLSSSSSSRVLHWITTLHGNLMRRVHERVCICAVGIRENSIKYGHRKYQKLCELYFKRATWIGIEDGRVCATTQTRNAVGVWYFRTQTHNRTTHSLCHRLYTCSNRYRNIFVWRFKSKKVYIYIRCPSSLLRTRA